MSADPEDVEAAWDLGAEMIAHALAAADVIPADAVEASVPLVRGVLTAAAESTIDERVELWRCAGCGKWSHAQRRPSAHQRSEVEANPITDEPETAYAVWCGPFERLVAVVVDPAEPARSPRIGQRVPDSERYIGEDPNAGIDSPDLAF